MCCYLNAGRLRPTWRKLTHHPEADQDPTDRGVTLLELLMVIAITSVVGAMVMATIIVIGNLVTKTTESSEEFIKSKQALEEISANLRGAVNTDQGRGRLTDASSRAIVFYTASGGGLNEPPKLMSYVTHGDTLYQLIPGPNANFQKPSTVRAVLKGITTTDIFEFYTWADPNNSAGDKCFRKLTNAELTQKNPKSDKEGNAKDGIHARNAIAGVKITLKVNPVTNVRYKDEQGHTAWIRLGESIEPKDPTTGALIAGWPQNCWKVFDD